MSFKFLANISLSVTTTRIFLNVCWAIVMMAIVCRKRRPLEQFQKLFMAYVRTEDEVNKEVPEKKPKKSWLQLTSYFERSPKELNRVVGRKVLEVSL
jgi:hypothetical protein